MTTRDFLLPGSDSLRESSEKEQVESIKETPPKQDGSSSTGQDDVKEREKVEEKETEAPYVVKAVPVEVARKKQQQEEQQQQQQVELQQGEVVEQQVPAAGDESATDGANQAASTGVEGEVAGEEAPEGGRGNATKVEAGQLKENITEEASEKEGNKTEQEIPSFR